MKISKIEIPKEAPETFEELCKLFLPRPIHDEAENAEMIRVMDWIAVRAQKQASVQMLLEARAVVDQVESEG